MNKPKYGVPPFCECFLYHGDAEHKFCTLCGRSYEDYGKLYNKTKPCERQPPE